MRKRTIDKGISAAGTVLFVGAINSVGAPLWAVAALALAVYEIGQMVCRIARRQARQERKRHYITATRLDMRRVEDQVFNPLRRMKEVS